MTPRKQIRAAIKARVEPLLSAHDPNLEVFTFQKAMVQTYSGLVCIFHDEGTPDLSMGGRDDLADLTIRILLTDRHEVDDALDEIGGIIETAIESDPFFGGQLSSCYLTGWAYERDISQGWTGLRLTYSTQFDA